MKSKHYRTVVLDMDHKQIPLRQFKDVVSAFFELLESVSSEASGAEPIQWTISVQEGSARVIARCNTDSDESEKVISALPNGLKTTPVIQLLIRPPLRR